LTNKIDLDTSRLSDSLQISALTGVGMTELKAQLVEKVLGDFKVQEETIVSNARHFEALQKTDEALSKAQEGLQIGTTGDFIAMDIRTAMRHLGNITGHIDVDTDILGAIFSKFCIGK
jgi:tRNA modification GTPase